MLIEEGGIIIMLVEKIVDERNKEYIECDFGNKIIEDEDIEN